MIKAYQRKYGEGAVEVYDIGDSVLVATRTEHEIKKMSQISITTMRKKNKLTAWSKKPFRITDKRMADGDDVDLAPKKLLASKQGGATCSDGAREQDDQGAWIARVVGDGE